MLAEIAGDELAQSIQLGIEYAPAPPFNSGRPELAPAHILTNTQQRYERVRSARDAAVNRAAARLSWDKRIDPQRSRCLTRGSTRPVNRNVSRSATFYTTGMQHSPTSATGTGREPTPWHAAAGGAEGSALSGWGYDSRARRSSFHRV